MRVRAMSPREIRRTSLGFALAIASLSGTGCILSPEVPQPELELPGAYIKTSANPRAASSPYDFAVFKSKRMAELIARSRGFNLSVAAAIAQIQQAEAQVRIAVQPLIPTVQAEGNGQATLTPARGGGSGVVTGSGGTVITSGGSGPTRSSLFTGQLTASYILDIWGKNQAALNAAESNEYAASFNAAAVAILTDSTVASTYFQAVATQKQIDIAKQNLAIAERTLNAIQARQRVGTASGLDVAQQQTLVYNVQVTIPPLERQLQQFAHALAVLVGTAPEFYHFKGEDLNSIAVPRIDSGLPSDLLCRRPDIAVAEAQLAGASFNVSSARAALFPTIQLTGAGGYESVALATLFQPQNVFYNAALGLTQPLTNLYQLRAQLDQNKAIYGQLLDTYRNTIITAFQNVEDALVAYRKNAEQERIQTLAVMSARKAFQFSEAQLKGGIIDITALLSIEQTLFTAENALVLVRLSRLQAAVSLYQALGGGWRKPPLAGVAEVPSLIEVRAKTQ